MCGVFSVLSVTVCSVLQRLLCCSVYCVTVSSLLNGLVCYSVLFVTVCSVLQCLVCSVLQYVVCYSDTVSGRWSPRYSQVSVTHH